MYDDLKLNTTQRIVEIREIIEFVRPQLPSAPKGIPRHLNTLKGLVYVQLYGLIEYVAIQLVSQTIEHINSAKLKITELKPSLYSLALHQNLESLNNANRAKWDKRHEVFNHLLLNSEVAIEGHLFPTDGKNIQAPQLQSICNVFNISKPYSHDIKFQSALKEIVGHRINIAHGNLTAAEVGAGVEINRLESRLNETSAFCSYLIDVFDNYSTGEEYKV
ncbi:hypothetical protein D0C36_12035 [Mucilaginibacter conchicola]|uniref:MAE-28990/MAE-18760-like HEPN domain-containing protein n=1 Tax=Mucilaginibacter conchicola TaxID=2303333 RepID=A0A372NSE1_9SPHI|nr:MAE_28990/MAE_18760 family HEPN-like nuclease [Mucilaginibacter conchicola]RFZ92165.1 hypothetical protein D0C36_12035 [Mucilaginibacter conchicola]